MFGGTFDPPHKGHLLLAKNALKELEADKIIFMTAGTPPHKDKRTVLDKSKRFDMVKLLVKGNSSFVASDLEIKENSKSYTADTLLKLKKIYKDPQIYFIVGLDSFYDIEKWYKPEIIFQNCIIAVALRGGISEESFSDKKKYYEEKYSAKIVNISMPKTDISSSDIRKRIAEGRAVGKMLTQEVLDYIEKNGLYKE